MSILGKFNQIMYQSRFSLFDAMWIIMISGLVASYGYWWYLMIVPCVAVSVKLERFYRNER